MSPLVAIAYADRETAEERLRSALEGTPP